MARGWESKSVEMQMEERERPRPAAGGPAADAGAIRERELLELTRKRLLGEISGATSVRFRVLKERALAHLDAKIAGDPLK